MLRPGKRKKKPMAATFSANLTAASPHHLSNRLSCLRPEGKPERITFLEARKRNGTVLWGVRSVLDNQKSSIHKNGATESTKILLERLFAQTQKLEEQIGRDPCLPEVAELGLNLEMLESDLQAALTSLQKKEEDLRNAEINIFWEFNELNSAKEELEHREEEIAAACSRKEILEEELRKANLVLASQIMVIEHVKLCLRERDQQILAANSALSLKEDEINKMSNDLIRKSEEVANAESELRSKAQLLNEANKIVRRQEVELQELRRTIQEKEEELEFVMTLQETERDELRDAEANLKRQTTDWLVAREELKKLEEEVSKHNGEANETLEDFRRVRKLLSDVRSELVSSQKAFTLSRQKIEEQEQLLEEKLVELETLKRSILSYMMSLKDATVEVESERVKFRVTEARNKELERELAIEKELISELQKELNKESSSLEQALKDMASLEEKLDCRKTEFVETENLLRVKESELVEARLEIQHLESELASFKSLFEGKDSELLNAQKMLALVNQEIAGLKMLMKNRVDQIIQATSALKEKEDNVQTIKHELDSTKQKFFEAESVVGKIVQLINDFALPATDEQCDRLSLVKEADNQLLTHISDKPYNFNWQKKQLDTELQLTRETLKTKEMEFLAAQRDLTIKDEELKLVLSKLDNKEMEVIKIKKEMNRDSAELRQLYALARERIGEKSTGDLAIEKLQLEAAQLEVEAASGALQKLTEMSRDLLNKARLSIEADLDISVMPQSSYSDNRANIDESGCLAEVKTEVAKLSALTERLVKEAGVIGKGSF